MTVCTRCIRSDGPARFGKKTTDQLTFKVEHTVGAEHTMSSRSLRLSIGSRKQPLTELRWMTCGCWHRSSQV